MKVRELLEMIETLETSDSSKSTIEVAEKKMPKSVMYDAESTLLVSECNPMVISNNKHRAIEDSLSFDKEMDRFIQEILVPGVDYGQISGFSKPCLYKSGAEKIARHLNILCYTVVSKRTEIIEQPYFAYECRCYGISSDGSLAGVGVGVANSREPQYIDQNPFAIQNTILKVCKKRSVVDLILHQAALSGKMTQDIEEGIIVPRDKGSDNSTKISKPATEKQIQFLEKLMEQHSTTPEAMNKYVQQQYNIEDYHDITGIMASQLIEKFKTLS